MSNVGKQWRSFKRITLQDLRRLLRIAREDRQKFLLRKKKWAVYRSRVLCVALCQGAASHYVDGKKGINDFDVYTFYRTHPKVTWYAKRIARHDFGDPKFGRSKDRPDFRGRRVDVLGRSIAVQPRESVKQTLRRYLIEGRTETARCLRMAPVVLLDPNCRQVVWRPPPRRRPKECQ